MTFYNLNRTRLPSVPPSGCKFPCALLGFDNFNDFGYVTSFPIAIFTSPDHKVFEGYIKVLQIDPDSPDQARRQTELPAGEFSSLTLDYCSIGIEIAYYEALEKEGPSFYIPFLSATRDVAMDDNIKAEFNSLAAFNTSMLRSSETQRALRNARTVFEGLPVQPLFKFKFTCRVPNAEEDHEVDFDFSPHPTRLNRTIVLIGRNGTGKTTFLGKFAQIISGQIVENEEEDSFQPFRPTFSRVIAISYSIFDDFGRPLEKDRVFSYCYCGVRPASEDEEDEENRILSQTELKRKLKESVETIWNKKRQKFWREIISILLEGQFEVAEISRDLAFYDRLSSGQKILVSVLTQTIGFIGRQSIILFDEPELHLHPEVFAALIRAFDRLLIEYDSYSIIATHSPLLLQETMARQVRVFDRVGKVPAVYGLGIESFGETLSTITKEVFEMDGIHNNFRSHLRELRKDHTSEEIEKMFPMGLPLLADSYLKRGDPLES